MTALENVMIGRHTSRSRAGFLSGMLAAPWTRAEERSIREEAMKAIELLGIAEYARQGDGSLPFGIQRSVELARALASEPRLLLLDEPASGLNVRETRVLAELISRIRGMGIADPRGRARHVPRDGHLGRDRGPELRQEDRPGRGPARSRRTRK